MRTVVVRVSVAHCSREITGDAAVLRLYVGIVYGPNIYQRYAFVRFKNRRIIGHMVGLFTIRGGLSDTIKAVVYKSYVLSDVCTKFVY